MLIDSGKIHFYMRETNTFHETRKELKKDTLKKEQKKIIAQGWRVTYEYWKQRRELRPLILKKWANYPQLRTNSVASSKRFIRFKYLFQSRKV